MLCRAEVSRKPWKGRCGAEGQRVTNMNTDNTEKEFCSLFKPVSHILIHSKSVCLKILQSPTEEAERVTRSDLDPNHAKQSISLGLWEVEDLS